MEYLATREYREDYFDFPHSYLTQSSLPQKFPRPRHASSKARIDRVVASHRLKIVAPPRAELQFVATDATIALRKEFKKLVRQWRNETMVMSSPQQMAIHPAYQRILALGSPAIPLIIEELREKGGHWYWALRFLANYDPVPKKQWGNVTEMKKNWLAWWDAKQAKVAVAA